MATVLLGNPAAIDIRDGSSIGEQITLRVVPDSMWTHDEHMRDLTHHREGVWVGIADEPPSWVASENDELARGISEHYGCPIVSMDEARQRFLDNHPHPIGLAHLPPPAAVGPEGDPEATA